MGTSFATVSGKPDRPPLFPAGLVGTFTSNDFDEIAALPPSWDQRYAQLGRGKFAGELFMAHTATMAVGIESWSPGISIRGSIPKSCVMFAVPLRRGPSLVNRGREVGADHGILLFDDEEMDFLTATPFKAFVLVCERESMERRVQNVLGRSLESLRYKQQISLHEPARLRAQLTSHTSRLQSSLLADPSPLTDPTLAADLESALVQTIFVDLDAPTPNDGEIIERRRAANHAHEILRDNVHNGMSISEVCKIVGTSERTLHIGFREQFGMTPKAYVKMLRLNAARHELRRAKAGQTVTEIATRWDFFHFGWFSHDYQRMFGELPSQTLQRHR